MSWARDGQPIGSVTFLALPDGAGGAANALQLTRAKQRIVGWGSDAAALTSEHLGELIARDAFRLRSHWRGTERKVK